MKLVFLVFGIFVVSVAQAQIVGLVDSATGQPVDPATQAELDAHTGSLDPHVFDQVSFIEKTADPGTPTEGRGILWITDGTNIGVDGDLWFRVTAGGSTWDVPVIQADIPSPTGDRINFFDFSTARGGLLDLDATLQITGTTLGVVPGGTEINDLSAIVTWAIIPDPFVSQSAVIQHESALTVTESQISDLSHTSAARTEATINSKTAGYAIGTDDADEMFGGMIYHTGGAPAVFTAAQAALGQNFCAQALTAQTLSLDVNVSDRMYLDGVALDDGDQADSTGNAGDMICCTYESAAGFSCISGSPTGSLWTDGG